MMKKYLLSILAAMLVFSFVGAAAAQDVVEIELWHRWGGEHLRIFDQIVSDFNDSHPHIKLTGVSVPGEYSDLVQRIFARLAARQSPPDILATGHYLLSYTATTFGARSLETLAGENLPEVANRFANPAMMEIGQIDGEQYGIPFCISNQVLFYNPEIFEAAGLDPNQPPRTWDEVREYAVQIKENTPHHALFIVIPDTWMMSALVESNGAPMKGEDGKAAFNSPEAVETMTMWRGFYEDGFIPHVSNEESERAFLGGSIGMYAQSVMRLSPYYAAAPWLHVSELPSFGDKTKRLPAGGSSLVILSRDEAKAAAAWEFLDYIVSPEAMAVWVETGYVNPLAADLPLINPLQQPAVDQLQYAIPWVDWGGPNGLEIEQVIAEARDKILYGRIGVQEGLDEAVQRVNELLVF
jgi:multiple sugar transport system substrate-binding protein